MDNDVYRDRLIFVCPPFPKSNKLCNSFHITNTNELFCTCKETCLLSSHLPSPAPTSSYSILGFYMTSRRSCAPIRQPTWCPRLILREFSCFFCFGWKPWQLITWVKPAIRRETRSEYFACQVSGLSEIFKLIFWTSEKIINNINVPV